MDVLYFAYGSCMSPEDLARDVSEFELIGPALVRGFRLGFTRYSRARRGGVADLVPDITGLVEGVLYRLPIEQLAALDEREGAPDNYRRDFIAVRRPDGALFDGVLTYVVADKASEEFPPHPDYVATILTGATAYLSPHYVEKIREHVQQLTDRKAGKDSRRQEHRAGKDRRDGREGRERKDSRERKDAQERERKEGRDRKDERDDGRKDRRKDDRKGERTDGRDRGDGRDRKDARDRRAGRDGDNDGLARERRKRADHRGRGRVRVYVYRDLDRSMHRAVRYARIGRRRGSG